MKKYLLPFMLLLLSACERESTLPEATTAAKEVYLQYADRKNLTVALIGDYEGYNAVMLQAQTPEDWVQLCKEFCIKNRVVSDVLDSIRVSNMTTYTVDSFNFAGPIDSAGALNFGGSIGEFMTDLLDSIVERHKLWDTAYSITRQETWKNGVLVDQSSDTTIGERPPENRLFELAKQKGNCGYLIFAESEELTLWLFFYSSKEELAQIINNITSINTLQ